MIARFKDGLAEMLSFESMNDLTICDCDYHARGGDPKYLDAMELFTVNSKLERNGRNVL